MTALPHEGRIAALDYGHVRIGVAVTDAEQMIGSPLELFKRGTSDEDARYFQTLVTREELVGFVVGLPVHNTGEESEKSREARQFGAWLGELTRLPVAYHDERFSSLAADRLLAMGELSSKQRKKRRDMLAAQIILTSYLESNRAEGGSPGPLG